MFSKYPDACEVMFIIRLAALHPDATPLSRAGHSAGPRSVPVAPPMRTWTSHSAADPLDAALRFHSMRIAPAVGPLGGDDKVLHLHRSHLAGESHPDERLGVVRVLEVQAPARPATTKSPQQSGTKTARRRSRLGCTRPHRQRESFPRRRGALLTRRPCRRWFRPR